MPPVPKFSFERKLSLDGVTFIIGLASVLLWLGSFRHQVETLQKTSDDHSVAIESVNKNVGDVKTDIASVRSDVAVLSAVMVERTGKPIK